MPTLAYPLVWPVGWPRVNHRHSNIKFKVPFGVARDELLSGLRLLHAKNVVISSNVPLRGDGLPYAGGEDGGVVRMDPGVAVYWVRKGQAHAIACDRWLAVRHNLRSIGLAIEGMRAIERSGASQLLDRAFAGFAALPSAIVTAPPCSWQFVLGFPAGARPPLHLVERAFKELVLSHHPDRGGSHERMVELNRAWEEAQRELA